MNLWPHRLMVRTPGSHPGNGGSIPPGATNEALISVKLELMDDQKTHDYLKIDLFRLSLSTLVSITILLVFVFNVPSRLSALLK